jgi:tRNA (guanine-N7-)-methyltransferase
MRSVADRPPFYRSLAPLLLWQQQRRPADWTSLFGRAAPLELEIGTGSGEFLARVAQERRDHDFVGVELRWASVKRTLRNLAKAEVGNARVVMEDARPVLERLFAPRSLARIHLLFPCPWRKEQHERHRITSRDFLELANSRLRDDGELLLVTDWKPLFEWTLGQVEGSGLRAQWQLVEPRWQTKYERKWSGLGQERFFEVRLHKEEHRDVAVPQDAVMNPPHLDHVDFDHFEPRDLLPSSSSPDSSTSPGSPGAATITFKEVVRDRERQVAMVRAVVVEEPLLQQIWLTVARAHDGSWWVVPARGCQMVPTAGVQRALERLAECARA